MNVLETALQMLEKYPLCNHCLGRQYALLGYGVENNRRGEAIKLSLTLQASIPAMAKEATGVKTLKTIALNGFSVEAKNTLDHLKRRLPKDKPTTCFLCSGRFAQIDDIVSTALEKLSAYEYTTFLVGIELPVAVEEREDEFKAAFDVAYSESIKHEFGRLIGKQLALRSGKTAEYRKPDIMVILNPFTQKIRLQVNPLFVAGRYRKLVRTVPQSKWFCSNCHGRGCEECEGTGKLYAESVEEFVANPLLEAAEGEDASFHASGREDIDARMLGTGRPFVVEVTKPKKRFLDLKAAAAAINGAAVGKVEVSELRFTSRDVVRKLKKAENAQKEYRVLVVFEKEVSEADLRLLEEKLCGTLIRQQTPLRVVHRRADLIRERYIYKLKVKKVSPAEAEVYVRCQGGLYVKELVSGDENRTTPSVSELLNNPAKTLELDVLNVIMDDPVGE
ncbi:MAG: tRNA pseudouridine(54/55) synthase Pus10 [Candidatus Bathyarchaeota archaeon]|nr:tRNA pseudouridine(54/55) synthase Pus10 [Candidatus Bathyarchaeota archaeon]